MALKIPREKKELLIKNIQLYFYEERSENIGELAAGNFLDFMIKQLEPIIYNQAISDARKVAMQQMDRMDEELYSLEKR